MPTLQDIIDALRVVENDLLAVHDPEEELSVSDNVSATDQFAGVLKDVNPNHQYPPVPKI